MIYTNEWIEYQLFGYIQIQNKKMVFLSTTNERVSAHTSDDTQLNIFRLSNQVSVLNAFS